jgi:diadenosine tetraphosphatase ApaH/serine/threonine PP2A family protein phosphatase
VTDLFRAEPVLLELRSPLIIVGDIHGQLLDFLRIFKDHGIPNNRTYLFMGDLVDRGPFSLEVLLALFVFKFYWPQRLFLIRGNHEFHEVCSINGFYEQIFGVYQNGLPVYGAFLNVFATLPLAAVIDRSAFVVHGGIGPDVTSLREIQSIPRPIDDFSLPIVEAMLWSDPHPQTDEFSPSTRGAGYLFGQAALSRFLTNNGLTVLVRGHESIAQGFEYQFDQKCLTAFSASNYCGRLANDGAILLVEAGTKIVPKVYHPLAWIRREEAKVMKEIEAQPAQPVSVEVAGVLRRNQIQLPGNLKARQRSSSVNNRPVKK